MPRSIVTTEERTQRALRAGRFADVFIALLEYTPEQLSSVLTSEDLVPRLQALPQGVALKWLIALQSLVSLAERANPMLLNSVFDRVDGKVSQSVQLSWREEVKRSGIDPESLIAAARRAFDDSAVGGGADDAGGDPPKGEGE